MKDNRAVENLPRPLTSPAVRLHTKAPTMKTKAILPLLALALAANAANLLAQDGNTQPGGRPPGGQRQLPPIVAALDANHDGTIDAGEIANASAALKTLDKNGDGKLTGDELRPQGQGGQGQQGGGRPPGGQGQDGPPQQ
ncbi:MAG: hypothetical protein RL380_263 [Verrucomicrobiota bacterium]